MYQVCPNCKQLMSDENKVCPHCGGGGHPKPLLYWCPSCKMWVTPIDKPLSGSGKFDTAGYILGGSNYTAWTLRGKQKKCPKCGRADLEAGTPGEVAQKRSVQMQENPLDALKLKLVRGEITEEEFLRKKKLIE